MRITAMVVFILIGSTVFTLVFRGVDGDLWIEHMLTSLPGGLVGFLIVVNLFVFFLAFFLDFFEIAFIIIPLLAPVAQKLGIDLIWFGVLLGVNMQTSFMHPPFGFALFYLRGIAPPAVKSSDIYWGAIPWVGLQLAMVRHRHRLSRGGDAFPRPASRRAIPPPSSRKCRPPRRTRAPRRRSISIEATTPVVPPRSGRGRSRADAGA